MPSAGMMVLDKSEMEDEQEIKLKEKDSELKRMQEMVAAMQEQITNHSLTSIPSLVTYTSANNHYSSKVFTL